MKALICGKPFFNLILFSILVRMHDSLEESREIRKTIAGNKMNQS